MKNLQIGDNDLIGNKFNGHDLHLYLNKIGIESHHLIANVPQSKDSMTFQIGSEYSQKIRNIMTETDKYYNLIAGTHTLPFDIIGNKLFLESDIVHLHLIHNYMFNVNLLPLMTSLKPTVWTIHDPFAITGHCTYPFDCLKWQSGCGDCDSLDLPFKIKKDSTALNWEMKRIAFQNSQITLIVASKWMQNLVKQSPLLGHCNLHVVPFGINHDLFKPKDVNEAKKKIGIPQDSLTLMFRMQDNAFKGGDLLLKALPKLKSKNKITLITVGQEGLLNHLKEKFNIIEFGWVADDKKLIQLYQACDIFLMPSKVEAFGMMAIEAMSCKKPVIVLKGTSLPDVVQAPNIGVECERDADSFFNAIQNLIDNKEEREIRAEKSYQYALKEYGSEVYIKRIVEVYKSAISNHKASKYRDHVVDQLIKHQPLQNKKYKDFSDFKLDVDQEITNNLEKDSPQNSSEVANLTKIYFFGVIPLIIKKSDSSFRIKIGKSITLFKRKKGKEKIRYYVLGILLLKIKYNQAYD